LQLFVKKNAGSTIQRPVRRMGINGGMGGGVLGWGDLVICVRHGECVEQTVFMM